MVEDDHTTFREKDSGAIRAQASSDTSAQDTTEFTEAAADNVDSPAAESPIIPRSIATESSNAQMNADNDDASEDTTQPDSTIEEAVVETSDAPTEFPAIDDLPPNAPPSPNQSAPAQTTCAANSSQSAHSTPPSQRANKRSRRHHYTLVEQGSLYDIMHENSGVALFIRPIAWTDKHNSALNVKWIDRPKIVSPSPDPNATRDPRRKLAAAAYILCKELSAMFSDSSQPFYSIFSIREVMSRLYPDSIFPTSRGEACPEMRLWFGSRVHRDAIRVQCLWRWPYPELPVESQYSDGLESFQTESTQPAKSSGAPPAGATEVPAHCGKPMLAYIGRKQLSSIRASIYRIALGPGRTPNEPVSRLQRLRSKLLIPANADYDPHLVAVLLAMAQDHIYPHTVTPYVVRGGIAPLVNYTPEFRDVTVRLISTDNAKAEFVIYTATFTADYLRQFHYPHKAFPQQTDDGQTALRPDLNIEVTKVPTWPIIGLRERLGQALGEEVVGSFDVDDPETWERQKFEEELEAEEAQEEPPVETKRRRDRPSFFNGNFEEEFPEPQRNGKRRRLSSNQVEVVM